LNRANLSWSINGTSYQSGLGLKKVNITTLGNGEEMVIAVSVVFAEGARISKSITVRPSNVDLLWEAYTSTPPFYQGKSLVSHEAQVKVLAVPDLVSSSGAKLNPNGLVYKWSKDGTVLGSQSGLGKNTFIFRMPQLTEISTITVEVTSADNLITARTSQTFRSQDPTVRMYENHPLFGVRFEKSLSSGDNSLEGSEIVIVGYPYFFSSGNSSETSLKYNWRINKLGTNVTTNRITLRAPEGQKGSSQINFKVDNMKEIMQSAESTVHVIFGGTSRDNNPFF
jgi:hypothetical protein